MTAKTTAANAAEPSAGNIYQRIPAIMREIDALPKGRSNDSQHYKFRGIDDVYNLVHPVMAKHGVFMSCVILSDRTEERQSRNNNALIYRVINARYRFTAEDGSYIETDVIGEGMDSGDKSANKAMSVGQKYAILQTFMVPTDEPKDPECDSPEVKPKPAAPKPTAPAGDDFFDEPPAPSKFAKLDEFAKAKKMIGAEAYYTVLAGYKAAHATDLVDDERDPALAEMRQIYRVTHKAAAK